MISIRAAAESHTGYVRTNNEDLAVVSSDLAAIADGMGGHLGGEVAARIAIEELVEAFQRDRTAAGLSAAVRRANRAIWRKSRSDRTLHGMGTTITAAALVERGRGRSGSGRLALVNVGDSRAYRLSGDGGERRLSRLTEDHSVVEEMVRQGELSPVEAASHPHRHVLTRVLGVDSEVDVDIWDLDPVPGTRLLLCTDGLTDEVPEEEIAEVLGSSDDPKSAARELVGRALAHGGMDNVTVVVLDVLDSAAAAVGQALEIVPARSAGADDEDRLGPDATQALPVTRVRRRRWAAAGAVEAAGLAGAAGQAEAEATAGIAPGEQGVPDEDGAPSGAGLAPTGAMAAASRGLEAPGAGPAADSMAAAGDPTVVLSDGPEAAAAVTGGSPGPSHRRTGRSMMVRAAPIQWVDPGERGPALSGAHTGPTVLVPSRALAKQYRDRIVTFRVFLFLVLLAALVGGVIGVTIWFQRSSFFVGLAGDRVSIFQGRPGGLIWFKPQLLQTSSLTTKDLLPNSVYELRQGVAESSYAAAKQEVDGLIRLSTQLGLNPHSPPPTATTTTLLPTTTTTAPAPSSSSTASTTAATTRTTAAPSSTTAKTSPISTTASTLLS